MAFGVMRVKLELNKQIKSIYSQAAKFKLMIPPESLGFPKLFSDWKYFVNESYWQGGFKRAAVASGTSRTGALWSIAGIHLRGLLSLFPARCVPERVRGSEEKPQVRKGGATGASAGANHTSAKQSREERDGIPLAMLAAIGDSVHLLGLVSHPPFHLLAVPAPTMESINESAWRHTYRALFCR